MRSTTTRAKQKDDRNKVTHYAFMVAPRLLGEPIARPWRRGLAQCVDLLLIGLLSQLPSILLAALTAMAFLRASRKNNVNIESTIAKKWMRGAGVLLLFLVALIITDSLKTGNTNTNNEQDFKKAFVYGAQLVAGEKCGEDIECLTDIAGELGQAFAKAQVSRADLDAHLTEYMSKKNLTEEQNQLIRSRYLESFDSANKTVPASASVENTQSSDNKLNTTTEDVNTTTEPPTNQKQASWHQGLGDQLGLGIGWAALYHSVFIAWFRGRTPGKKVMKIRVVKLDGSPFSLWDSFSRYGGYCAGFATGSLGFLQIYWDANRQAIQDKIAESVVIFER